MKNQLELSFDNATRVHPESRRRRHLRQARWWFEQMRQVVDRALDRAPYPPGRPEQIYFPLRRGV